MSRSSRPLHLKALSRVVGLALAGAFISLPAAPPSAEAAPAPAVPSQGIRYRDPVLSALPVRREPGIVYGRAVDIFTGDTVDLALDLYEAQGDTETARGVFLFIHGGGFRGGNRSTGRQYLERLVPYGYVGVSISYRLNQGDLWTVGMPAAVSDARQAVAWLRDQADERRLDPDKIIIGGSSAGAITALMLAYTDIERADAPPSSGVKGVVDWWGGMYDRVDELSAGHPPLVIIHGTEDRTVPFEQAEMLRDRAEAVGVPYAYYPLEGQGHAVHDAARDVPRVVDFFYAQVFDRDTAPTSIPPMPTVPAGATPTQAATPTNAPTPAPTDRPIASPSPAPSDDVATLYLPLALRAHPLDGAPRPTLPPPAASPSPAASATSPPTPTGGMVVRRGLRYLEPPDADPDLTSVDVYAPRGARDAPVMVYVHGGGWSAGDKRNVGRKAEAFVDRGWVFVSANYRLTPDVAFPRHAEDLARAVAFVREEIGRVGGDPEQLFLMGHSAGAHLVALLGTDPRYLAAEGIGLADLRAVVPVDTQAYDIPRLAALSPGGLSAVYRATFGEDPAFWSFASPITYVEADRGIPPFCVAYSGGATAGESPRRRALSEAFVDALDASGVETRLVPAPEKTHGQINQELGMEGDPVTEAVFEFLEGYRD